MVQGVGFQQKPHRTSDAVESGLFVLSLIICPRGLRLVRLPGIEALRTGLLGIAISEDDFFSFFLEFGIRAFIRSV